MARHLVSIPARVTVYVTAESEEDITEETVIEALQEDEGALTLEVGSDVFTDEFEVLDSFED